MNIEIGDCLTLDEKKEYVVVSQTIFDDKTYLLLVEKIDLKPMFARLNADEIIEIEDKSLIRKLMPMFADSVSPMLEYLLQNLEGNL